MADSVSSILHAAWPMLTGTIWSLHAEILAGRTSCEEIVAAALARASDLKGEGDAAFRGLRKDQAIQQARAHDLLRKTGTAVSPLAGLPVSIKDNIDFVGEVTGGGCKLLENAAPARSHAAVVKRLHAAGAVIVGRTNMTELAFSGIGYNRFYGTPANPFARDRRLIPAALHPARRFRSPTVWPWQRLAPIREVR